MFKLQVRSKKSVGSAPLFTRVRTGKQTLWVNLRLTVDIAKWWEVDCSELKRKNFLVRLGHYNKLQEIEVAFQDLKFHNRLNKENIEKAVQNIVLAEARERFDKAIALAKEVEERKNKNIKNFLIAHVEGINNGAVRASTGEKYAPNSVKVWNQFKRIFLEFYNIRPFDWQDINQTLADRFIAYLEEDCSYMRSSIQRLVKVFLTIIRVAENSGVHTNYLAKSAFHIPPVREQDKATEIYLKKEELKALYEMELEGLEEKVRDVFLIGCYTAQRFSDYRRIDERSICTTPKGTKVIKLAQIKTKSKVVVPILDPKLEFLLKKYSYNVPNLNDVVFNRYIKEICHRLSETIPSFADKERTKLNKKERQREQNAGKKGKKIFEYDEQGYPVKPRWQLVCSHTARRTAITNMFISGNYTLGQMMSVSGHKKESTFREYIKLSQEEFADNVAKASGGELF